MKELDLVLERFLDGDYDSAAPPVQAAFADLLEQPDPDLYAYLTGKLAPPDTASADVIARLRAARRA